MEKVMENKRLSNNILKIIIGSLISFTLTSVMIFIYASILVTTDINENTIKPVVILISGSSLLVGSFISTFKLKKNGIINGAVVGIIYISIIYILSSIWNVGFSLNVDSVIMIIASIICGMIGGILGVNIKEK